MNERFEWDQSKALANYRNHGVHFSTEKTSAFEDPDAVEFLDDASDAREPRFILLGMSDRARLIVVVYVIRGNMARIISARPATRSEDGAY